MGEWFSFGGNFGEMARPQDSASRGTEGADKYWQS